MRTCNHHFRSVGYRDTKEKIATLGRIAVELGLAVHSMQQVPFSAGEALQTNE